MFTSIEQTTANQDMIGWRKFMEGNVSTNKAGIQWTHCAAALCMLNGDNWLYHFISHMLHILTPLTVDI
jgi:hypothetical protein